MRHFRKGELISVFFAHNLSLITTPNGSITEKEAKTLFFSSFLTNCSPPPPCFLFYSQLAFVCNLFHETLSESNVNVFESLPAAIKTQLQDYLVGPTWLKPNPFGFSVEIRDANEMQNGVVTGRKLFPSGELKIYLYIFIYQSINLFFSHSIYLSVCLPTSILSSFYCIH